MRITELLTKESNGCGGCIRECLRYVYPDVPVDGG